MLPNRAARRWRITSEITFPSISAQAITIPSQSPAITFPVNFVISMRPFGVYPPHGARRPARLPRFLGDAGPRPVRASSRARLAPPGEMSRRKGPPALRAGRVDRPLKSPSARRRRVGRPRPHTARPASAPCSPAYARALVPRERVQFRGSDCIAAQAGDPPSGAVLHSPLAGPTPLCRNLGG
jgi:hypothetical protein